jgi:kynurenine formamidase
MRVRPHWRFQSELTPLSSLENGDHSAATRITLGSHTFTHVDAPSHMIKGGLTLDRMPLDRFWGKAAVVDLQDVPDDHPITAEVLKMRGEHVRRGDIALLCTGLDARYATDTREYWLHAPWLDHSAAEWLRDRRVKAVGYDFPQDHVIRRLPEPALKLIDFPVHQVLLVAEIVQVEYLVNLTSVTEPRVTFFALPLSLGALDGSPCRAVALLA